MCGFLNLNFSILNPNLPKGAFKGLKGPPLKWRYKNVRTRKVRMIKT